MALGQGCGPARQEGPPSRPQPLPASAQSSLPTCSLQTQMTVRPLNPKHSHLGSLFRLQAGEEFTTLIPTPGCKFFLPVPKTPNLTAPKSQQDAHIHDNEGAVGVDGRGQRTRAPPAPGLALSPLEESQASGLSQSSTFQSSPASEAPPHLLHSCNTHTHSLRHTHIRRHTDPDAQRQTTDTRSQTLMHKDGSNGGGECSLPRNQWCIQSLAALRARAGWGLLQTAPPPSPLHADGQPAAPLVPW